MPKNLLILTFLYGRDGRDRPRGLLASEERTDIKNEGFPWPGEWTVERDEVRQKTQVRWKGKDGYEYPWGTENDLENLTYEGGDAHPHTCSVRGEAESIFTLKGGTLVWRGRSPCDHGSAEFLLQVHARLIEGRPDSEIEDVAGNDSARSTIVRFMGKRLGERRPS